MKMSAERFVPAPQQAVWDALNNPEVLKACVPGCESITQDSDTQLTVLMTARIGPVAAKFKGKITLTNVNAPTSYSLGFDGQGGVAGFGKGGADVKLSPATQNGQDGTTLAYDVNAQVGGKLAQIGSRLVDAAAAKMADDFFERFVDHFPKPEPVAGAAVEDRADPTPQSIFGKLIEWLSNLFGGKK